ncbi:NAD(P)-binding Rossmann-fold superfamily protein [Rhynchospora pubera]|uniref:NAD(P)-binding Rossmann-fold superfamily protein n=1 Tax=Rhynchospora pubera TaxID=906938 RepID=A0AAV8HNL2_9POAL|nr:NAD(P)-binding Rossmann-fold superfamily protein [Rhynchospora pubera]
MAETRLKGKVAIITGAASGIGEATARLFASHGATVVIADIQDELGSAVAASIGAEKCSYVHCDVTEEAQVESTVRYAVAKHGHLDIMYSNAGILLLSPSILELDMGDFDKVMSVNVRGTAAALKHAGRAMVAAGIRGSIICTGSIGSCQSGNGPAGYITSKHAILGLVRAAAADLGPHGIRVNCVSPSGVATPSSCRATRMTPEEVEQLNGSISSLKGAVLKANHVAAAVLFLASDESGFISGHNLMIDGGSTVVNTVTLQIIEQASNAA